MVTYQNGRLCAYRNGQPVTKTNKVRGDFSNWKKQNLLFGDESGGERNWNGTLEGIAIYRRALSDDDVKRQWQAVRAKLALRKPVKTHRVRARVTETSTPPTRKQIGNYQNALLVHRLQVTKVIRGKKHLRAGQQITVADWAILNDKTQPPASWKKGQTLTLTLQPFDRQPQLESLYIANEIGDGLEAPDYWSGR
jgi:hypothetical protein